jgi:hypothetical protein
VVKPTLQLGLGTMAQSHRRSRNGGFTPGDAKIKSWHDGMGKWHNDWAGMT